MKTEFGKYLIDVSKLVLGGVVLSSVLEMSINKLVVIIAGVIAAIGFLIFGLIILKEKNNGSFNSFYISCHSSFYWNNICFYLKGEKMASIIGLEILNYRLFFSDCFDS